MHYSLSTGQVYLYWARFFIRWSGYGGAMRHPRETGAGEVEALLAHLATVEIGRTGRYLISLLRR